MKSVHAARLYFVEEPAEAVVTLDAGSWRADETELPRTRIGRLELERAVRPVAVAVDEDPQHTLEMASVHDWRACWVTQRRWGSLSAAEADAPAAKTYEEEHVQPLQRDGLDGEEVDREHALRSCPQKRTPPESSALASRAKPRLPQDLPHRCRGDINAEPAQLADDPLVAPPRVLTRKASTNARTSPPIGGRPLRPPCVERLATRCRCQRSSVPGVTKSDRQRARGSSRLAAARSIRSARVTRGRPTCRRSTASSCPSRTISSSSNRSERGRSETSYSTQRSTR